MGYPASICPLVAAGVDDSAECVIGVWPKGTCSKDVGSRRDNRIPLN